MKIAVDFDGTIVEHKYPEIGEEMLFAFQTLKMLQKQGHILVLWTYRAGIELEDAVEFCRQNGVEFYAVNRSYPEEEYDESISRKIDADIFIDDRNLEGFPGWSKVWQMIGVGQELTLQQEMRMVKKSRKKLFGRKKKSNTENE